MQEILRGLGPIALLAALVIAATALWRRTRTPGSSPSSPPDARHEKHPAETESRPLPRVLIDPSIIVHKNARRLAISSDGVPVKEYRVALGSCPERHKLREGDGRTPEGAYYVCVKNPDSKFHRALGLSYPNDADADAALAARIITARDHRAILGASRRMAPPPWRTPLGGEIMIHGGGSHRGDWTQGCIALDDADIEELFSAVPLGTPVRIEP